MHEVLTLAVVLQASLEVLKSIESGPQLSSPVKFAVLLVLSALGLLAIGELEVSNFLLVVATAHLTHHVLRILVALGDYLRVLTIVSTRRR